MYFFTVSVMIFNIKITFWLGNIDFIYYLHVDIGYIVFIVFYVIVMLNILIQFTVTDTQLLCQ